MSSVKLWFGEALLPEGWARDVRIAVADGRIANIETGVARAAGDEVHAVAVRGPSGDSFWTWREVMYRFVERLDPDAFEAIAQMAYVEMLEAGFTRVGEFHYLHHDPSGAAYDNPAEMAARVEAAAEATGIGVTLLPVFYAHSGFGGKSPKPSQKRFIHNI